MANLVTKYKTSRSAQAFYCILLILGAITSSCTVQTTIQSFLSSTTTEDTIGHKPIKHKPNKESFANQLPCLNISADQLNNQLTKNKTKSAKLTIALPIIDKHTFYSTLLSKNILIAFKANQKYIYQSIPIFKRLQNFRL